MIFVVAFFRKLVYDILLMDSCICFRSHKEKRSAYAPPEGVRYDGVYRIEKCWRKVGKQVSVMILVCNYKSLHLFNY